MKWPKRSLGVVVPLRQSVIIIIIISVLFTFSAVLLDRYVVRQKMGDLMNLADAKYVHVLDFLDLTKGITRNQADSPTIREALTAYERARSSGDQAKIQDQVDKSKAIGHTAGAHAFGKKPLARDRFHEVLVTDDKGRVVAASKPGYIGESLAKTAMWREGRRKTIITDPFKTDDGHVVFAVASPIYAESGQKGRVVGTFITHVDTGLLTMIMNADLGNIIGGKLFFAGFQYRSMDIYLMDSQGRLITQSRLTGKNTVLSTKGSALPLARTLDRQASGERITNVGVATGARETMDIYSNRAGVMVAGASMPVFDRAWTVVVEQDTKDAFASLINLERALIIGGILAAFLAGLASWTAMRKIADSLATLNAASVRLAAGDLDTPVASLAADYIELATLAGSFNIMKENLRKNLAEISKSNERLRAVEIDGKRTIDDLLEFIHPSRLDLREESLNGLVEDALPFLAIPKNIILEKDYDPAFPTIEGDRPKLLQALINVLARAVKAMPDGGRLAIKTAGQEGQALISIADTGAGIDPSDVAGIFEPTYSAVRPEIGLALPLARRYIEQHGGKISVSVAEGTGTQFYIQLPLKMQKAA